MIIILPILSYAIGVLLVNENEQARWVEIPREVSGSFMVPAVGEVYYVYILAAVIVLVVLLALLTVVYAALYRLVGPPTYGPLDVPPPHYRGRRR
jgi:hypothetical protein